MEKRLLNILRCPITQKGLSTARPETLSRVNQAIEAGQLSNREGNVLTDRLSDALITDDHKLLYPVANGIPVLLESESVNIAELE